MRLIRTLFVAALAMGASLAHADDSAAVQRLTGLLNKAQTLTARFSQLTLDGSGTRLQETAGQLSLKYWDCSAGIPMRRTSNCSFPTARRSGCTTRTWSR